MSGSIVRFAGPTTWIVAALGLCTAVWAQSKDDAKKMVKDFRNRKDAAPVVGSEAPNFKLKRLHSEDTIELASFKGKKPVVLVFGSYT